MVSLSKIARIASGAMLVVLLAGCAATKPLVAQDFTGPTATLHDAAIQLSTSKGMIFAAVEVDGERIDNAFAATQRATAGRGPRLYTKAATRRVPLNKMRVKLRGSHIAAAPIQEIASRAAGTFHEVEGEVDWTPQQGVSYIVRGELSAAGSRVWIEELESRTKVVQVVSTK